MTTSCACPGPVARGGPLSEETRQKLSHLGDIAKLL